jgi:hypothetical protein
MNGSKALSEENIRGNAFSKIKHWEKASQEEASRVMDPRLRNRRYRKNAHP